jgi:hypothetical protein
MATARNVDSWDALWLYLVRLRLVRSTVCWETALFRGRYAGGNGLVARRRQASPASPGRHADRGPA